MNKATGVLQPSVACFCNLKIWNGNKVVRISEINGVREKKLWVTCGTKKIEWGRRKVR